MVISVKDLQQPFDLVQYVLGARAKNNESRIQILKEVAKQSNSIFSYQEIATLCNHLDSSAIERAKDLIGIVTLYISCSNPSLRKSVTALWNQNKDVISYTR